MDKNRLLSHQKFSSHVNIEYNNVNELFVNIKEKTPSKTFVICIGKREDKFSYNSFFLAYMRFAKYLQDSGLSKGHRINLLFSNSPEFLLLYFAALSIGITVVPINPDFSPKEIDYIINNSNSKAVFYGDSLESKIKKLKSATSRNIIIEVISLKSTFKSLNSNEIELDRIAINKVELHDEAVIIYTSGTTGNPKGVVLSHLNLLADSKAISEWFEFGTITRTLCILPLFHNNGQITTLLAPLYAGGSTVIVRGQASIMSFWYLIEKYKITWTSVMASILSILLSLSVQRKDDTLKAILCGGQVLTRSVQEKFERTFKVPIFEGYGLTETTSFSCINNYPSEERKVGSIGKPLHINDMSIIDESGNHLDSDVEGEICIRGYNVACEYLGLPEQNTIAFAGGWFHSGDYGYKDNKGFFFFNGRKDSLIIKGGENIYPAELENLLYKHPAIEECAVIGIPDALLGENICAFVKCKSDDVSERKLKSYCEGKISAYKQAKRIIILNKLDDLDEIPKGPTKKVLYRKLKEYYIHNIQIPK